MAIWVILTTCLTNGLGEGRDYNTRKNEYMNGISKFIKAFQGCNIVIVENQSILTNKLRIISHLTFLNTFNIPVLYTTTNKIITRNYGMKELLDVFECIKKFNIQDDDFIIKATGRYLLKEDSEFVKEVSRLSETNYDAIIRYGSYMNDPPTGKEENCVTGLIGLRCKYVKEIEIPDENTFVEWKWAKKIASLDDSKVCPLRWLGIYIRPEQKKQYFLV
jgi:hypothetical protein